MKNISNKKKQFNDFRFEGLNWKQDTNKYITMDRVSNDESKIVIKVASCHLLPTKYGFAFILDRTHVVFIKEWQVNQNYYGNEIILTKQYFNVKEWGEHIEFGDAEPSELTWEDQLETAKLQAETKVHWEI